MGRFDEAKDGDVKKIAVTIGVILLVAALGCQHNIFKDGSSSNSPNKPYPRPDFDLVTDYGILYILNKNISVDGEIIIKGEFTKDVVSISIGAVFKTSGQEPSHRIIPSQKKPIDYKWEDTFKQKDLGLKPGLNKLYLIATFSDGDTVKTDFELMTVGKNIFNLSYNRKLHDTPQKIIIESKFPLNKIKLYENNKETRSYDGLKMNNFILEASLRNDKTSPSYLLITNIYGIEDKIVLHIDGEDDKRIYFFGVDIFGNEDCLMSIKTNGSDLIREKHIKPIEYIDTDLKKYERCTTKKGVENKTLKYFTLKALSPDLEWAFLWVENKADNAVGCDEDGRKIRGNIKLIYSLIYNLKTDKYKVIGRQDTKEYETGYCCNGFPYKQSGKLYYPVLWQKEELVLMEQEKENKYFGGEFQDAKLKVVLDDNSDIPCAKAKFATLSLKTLDVSYADNKKPLRNAISYANHDLGIIAYSSPYEDMPVFPAKISGNWSFVPSTIGIYNTKQEVNIKNLLEKVKPVGFKMFMESKILCSYMDQNKKKHMVFRILYCNPINQRIDGREPDDLYYKRCKDVMLDYNIDNDTTSLEELKREEFSYCLPLLSQNDLSESFAYLFDPIYSDNQSRILAFDKKGTKKVIQVDRIFVHPSENTFIR